MNEDKMNKLGRAQASFSIGNVPGEDAVFNLPTTFARQGINITNNYHKLLKVIRHFYTYDSIAGPVIDRMADMSMTPLINKRKSNKYSKKLDETVYAYYDAVASKLRPMLRAFALEYLLHGMVIADYRIDKIRGDLLSEQLGRKRYSIPVDIWVRNPDNIRLKKKPYGSEPSVYMRLPKTDVSTLRSSGMVNGVVDQRYQQLVDLYPEDIIKLIKTGKTDEVLLNVKPILRKYNSYSDYPKPYLTNAIASIQHKDSLKAMDKAIINRAIEAIRIVRTGDKDFPADDEKLEALRLLFDGYKSDGERVWNLLTDHTTEVEWSYPPFDALLNEAKYADANSEIFLALGFPRIFISGETMRSNSSDSSIASLGPKATLDDMREAIIEWVKYLYQELATLNDFDAYPVPAFTNISIVDYTALVQFASEAYKAGAISKQYFAQLFGTDYDTEAAQIEFENEIGLLTPEEKVIQQGQEFARETSDIAFERQKEVMDKQAENDVQQAKQDKQQQQQKKPPTSAKK